MANTIRTYATTITVSGGTGQKTIKAVDADFRPITDAGGHITQLLVKAPQPDNLFDFKITDSDDYIVFEKKGITGKLNDITRLPVRGNLTIDLTNAENGTYNMKIIFEELW